VNQQTLESSKVRGLYFAGEILDVDGDCGGFNLQWAWSSGYTAGYFSSLEEKEKK
jgi:predicted flavoprotein YhiN